MAIRQYELNFNNEVAGQIDEKTGLEKSKIEGKVMCMYLETDLCPWHSRIRKILLYASLICSFWYKRIYIKQYYTVCSQVNTEAVHRTKTGLVNEI
jgi:hypothetical protein